MLLGPTVFGRTNPDLYQTLFSSGGTVGNIMGIVFQFSLMLTMFAAGFEVDLSTLTKHKKTTLLITSIGIIIPFIIGSLFGQMLNVDIKFSLFLGVAFTITALPVIIKILIDSQLIYTQMGSTIISIAILTDIIGFMLFGFVTHDKESPTLISVLLLPFLFITTITISKYGRALLDKMAVIKNWPSFSLSLSICLCMVYAILCQYLHIHSFLGAFLAGIALRDIFKAYPNLKEILNGFIVCFFSPLFFVSIGLKVNFIENFNLELVVLILLLASISKIAAVQLGAIIAGIKSKDAFLIGLILNARGAMEIIFSTIALNMGIISNTIYVALVIMALISSVVSSITAKQVKFKFLNISNVKI